MFCSDLSRQTAAQTSRFPAPVATITVNSHSMFQRIRRESSPPRTSCDSSSASSQTENRRTDRTDFIILLANSKYPLAYKRANLLEESLSLSTSGKCFEQGSSLGWFDMEKTVVSDDAEVRLGSAVTSLCSTCEFHRSRGYIAAPAGPVVARRKLPDRVDSVGTDGRTDGHQTVTSRIPPWTQLA